MLNFHRRTGLAIGNGVARAMPLLSESYRSKCDDQIRLIHEMITLIQAVNSLLLRPISSTKIQASYHAIHMRVVKNQNLRIVRLKYKNKTLFYLTLFLTVFTK